MKRLLAASMTALLLTACGGGGGGGSTTPQTQTRSKTQSQGSVVISIPTGGTQLPSTRVKYPQFVSAGADSVSLSVNGGAMQIFDVSPTSTLCASVSGARNCTLSFGAPVGTDTFAFTVYAGANATGATLATATTTQSVVSGQGFAVTVGLNAVVGTIVANLNGTNAGGQCPGKPAYLSGSNSIFEGCAGTASVTVTVFDPSGAQVTGTAPYATAIGINPSDGSITASPTQITAPGQTVALTYNGSPFAATVSTSVSVNITIGTTILPQNVPVRRSYLYVANSNAPFGLPPTGGGSVAVYQYGSNTTTAPVRTYSGTNTGLTSPVQPLIDASGNLYVLDNGIPSGPNFNAFIYVFAPTTATGTVNVAPIRTISNMSGLTNQACTDMTFDTTGTYLIVACGTEIEVFPTTANGTASSQKSAQMEDEGLATQIGVAVSPGGDLYIADNSYNVIDIVPNGAWQTNDATFQNIGASHTLSAPIGWPNTLDPIKMAIDQNSTLYAPIYYSNGSPGAPDASAELAIWKGAVLPCSACAPSASLIDAPFSTHAVLAVTIDPEGEVYVANIVNNQIAIFSPSTIAGASVGTGGSIFRLLNNSGSGQASSPIGMAIGP